MTVWEYLVVQGVSLGGQPTVEGITQSLEQHGKDGWELVTIQTFFLAEGKHTLLLIFKRPMPLRKPRV